MEEKVCKYCGSPSHYSKKYKKYQPYCLSCKNIYIREKREQTMLEKYGVKNPSQLDSHKKVMEKVNEKRRERFRKGETQSWMKGKTKESDPRIASLSKSMAETKKRLFAEGKLEVWNKGLTKETDDRLKNLSESMKKSWEGRELSEAQKEHLQTLIKISKLREKKKVNPEIKFRRIESVPLNSRRGYIRE